MIVGPSVRHACAVAINGCKIGPWLLLITNKFTKHQFIQLLTATLKNAHIENSKNHKR